MEKKWKNDKINLNYREKNILTPDELQTGKKVHHNKTDKRRGGRGQAGIYKRRICLIRNQ